MAVTKIKPIRGTVNKALAYILDPKKTDDQLYVSSFGCAASDAAAKEFEWTRNLATQQGAQIPKVIARHLIQSFDVGEVSPEVAHEIGKQFADEWLKGKYEYVIATHIQNSIKAQESKGYEHWAKLNNLKEAARTINYLTENGLLRYADLDAKAEDIHSSYDRTGKELKGVEVRLREIQPLIKNIGNYQRLKPVNEVYQKAKDKTAFRAKHEAELVIFEAAKSTLLAIQGDGKLPSLKALQAEQDQLTKEQQRLYAERAKLKKEAKQIDIIKANVDSYLSPTASRDRENKRNNELE